ncbi:MULTISPECIES: hypothetical protein [Clostridioides]|nr:hypothetical protein [Clostridioides difficile]MCC0664974.1 hypothetical protein [Clostridioides sp. ZZV15-6597]MCC0699467.1 hypothetical protein [Clostridioides sp. ZZV15-6383]EGT3815291.1 hypothetical protein [Clostridioides difficile]EGT3953452.1 hypothetical protein [Clostridioides difficile]EGT4202998.1 hypothetical protein [Clostridioides difficile]
MEVKQILKNKDGNSFIIGLATVLIIIILFVAICEYMRNPLLLKSVRDGFQRSITSITIENYDELYPFLRRSYGTAYKLGKNDTWEVNIDKGNIEESLKKELGLKKEGNKYIKPKGDGAEYEIKDINLEIINREINPKDISKAEKFTVKGTLSVKIYSSFGFEKVKPLETKIQVYSACSTKF